MGRNLCLEMCDHEKKYLNFDKVNPCPAELFFLFFIHSKLQLLTQYPASNNEKCLYLKKNSHL